MSQSQPIERGIDTVKQDRDFFEELANTELRCSKYAEQLLEVAEE